MMFPGRFVLVSGSFAIIEPKGMLYNAFHIILQPSSWPFFWNANIFTLLNFRQYNQVRSLLCTQMRCDRYRKMKRFNWTQSTKMYKKHNVKYKNSYQRFLVDFVMPTVIQQIGFSGIRIWFAGLVIHVLPKTKQKTLSIRTRLYDEKTKCTQTMFAFWWTVKFGRANGQL